MIWQWLTFGATLYSLLFLRRRINREQSAGVKCTSQISWDGLPICTECDRAYRRSRVTFVLISYTILPRRRIPPELPNSFPRIFTRVHIRCQQCH